MAVGCFRCENIAILVHKKTCIYSFMTLTCRAEDDLFIFWGDLMFHPVDINWGKPLNHTTPPSPMSRDAFYQIFCLYIYVWPHSDKIFEVTSFRAGKGGFWPSEHKRPRVGSDHHELAMAHYISYQEILVKKLAENILRAGPGSRPIIFSHVFVT